LSQRQGPYRPGSTARDAGSLNASQPAVGTQSPMSNPTGTYQPAAAAQPGSYAYPTTGR
jgi:hypothetical protein